jgi:hypothetical protein
MLEQVAIAQKQQPRLPPLAVQQFVRIDHQQFERPVDKHNMGVEYRQNFVVKDLDWLPSADTAERIDAVLRKWQIVRGLKSTDLFPSGEATLYQWDTDGIPGAMIERVAGPSIFDEAETDSRYIDVISLLIGTDFHVHKPSETMSVDVITGPVVDGEELPATECDDVARYVIFETFANSSAGSHPIADVELEAFGTELIEFGEGD